METGVDPHDSALLETRSALVYKGFPPDHCCVDQAFRIAPRAEDGAPGDWIVLFVTGGPNEPNLANHIVVSRSRDEGMTWSDADVVLRLADRYRADPRLIERRLRVDPSRAFRGLARLDDRERRRRPHVVAAGTV